MINTKAILKMSIITMIYSSSSWANNMPVECKSSEANQLVNKVYQSQFDKEFTAQKRITPDQLIPFVYETLSDPNYKNGDFKRVINHLSVSLTKNADTKLSAVRESAYDKKTKVRTCNAVLNVLVSNDLIDNYQELAPNDKEFINFTNGLRNKELGTYNIEYLLDKDASGNDQIVVNGL